MKNRKIAFYSIFLFLIFLCLFFFFSPKNEKNIDEESFKIDAFENLNEENFSIQEENFPEEYSESYDDFPKISELHWGKMPIGYNVTNPGICGDKILWQIIDAFKTIENLTEGTVSFEEKNSSEGNIILFECFHRYGDNVDISFRAGNTYAYAKITYVYADEKENVIHTGEIKLHRITPGSYYGRCGAKDPTILHEILHLFGFEDNGKPSSIMYRYIGNCVEIDKEIITKLKKTYSKD